MLEKIQKFREYLDYIERHYINVQKAWKLINDKCQDKGFRFMDNYYIYNSIDQNVKHHDLSKLSEHEFTQFRQYYYPTSNEIKDGDKYLSAWTNHLKENKHHWQSWIVYKEDDNNAYIFLIENIVDWMAMGIEFGNTAKEYYENNKGNIHLPEWAITEMYKIFDCIYPLTDEK